MSNIEARTLAQHKLINIMLRSKVDEAKRIATLLKACSREKPCRSAACLLCGTRFQQAAVSVVEQFIGQPAQAIRGRKHALTIVPSTGCVTPNELTVGACKRVSAEIRTALEKLDLPPIVMGLEVSFNEDTTGKFKPHWCIHPHGIGLDWLSDAQVEGLQAIFPPSAFVKRPIDCVPLDNNVTGVRYANKPERFRRVTFRNATNPNRKPYRDTKRRPLRPDQTVSLAIVEHELGFGWRLLPHGISREAVRQHLAGFGWPRDGP